MYNSMNLNYQNLATSEWAYSGAIIGPNPTDFTVNKASIATLLCPSDGTVLQHAAGYAQYINYQPGNFNYVGNTGHPQERVAAGRPTEYRQPPAADRHHVDVEDVSGAGLLQLGGVGCDRQRQRHAGEHHRRDFEHGRGERVARERRVWQQPCPNKLRNLYYTSRGPRRCPE